MKIRSSPNIDNGQLLFARSLAAVGLWLEAAWSRVVEEPVLTAVFSDTPEADRQSIIASGQPQFSPTRLPWVSIVQATMQANNVGPFAPWQLFTFGIDLAKRPIGKTPRPPRDRAHRAYLVPVSVGLGIKFRTTSVEEANMFASIWMQYQPALCVDVPEDKSGATFRIHIVPEGAVTIPAPMDGSGPQGKVYDVETTAIVNTYLGRIETAEVIKQVDLTVSQPPMRVGALVSKQIELGKFRFKSDGQHGLVEF